MIFNVADKFCCGGKWLAHSSLWDGRCQKPSFNKTLKLMLKASWISLIFPSRRGFYIGRVEFFWPMISCVKLLAPLWWPIKEWVQSDHISTWWLLPQQWILWKIFEHLELTKTISLKCSVPQVINRWSWGDGQLFQFKSHCFLWTRVCRAWPNFLPEIVVEQLELISLFIMSNVPLVAHLQ